MDLHDTIINFDSTSTVSKDNRLVETRFFSSSLGVDSNHTKGIPNFFKKDIESQLHGDRNACVKWLLRDVMDLLNRNLINFVVDIEALNIFSVPFNNINEFIHIVITSKRYMCIMDLIFMQNILNQFFVHASGLLYLSVKLDTTSLLLSK